MKKNTKTIRTIVAVVVFAVLSLCLIYGVLTGTFSGFGPTVIATICPLGAFETMLASKTLIPRGIVSIVVLGVIVLVVGRAFCAWLCPVGILETIKQFFHSPKHRSALQKAKHDETTAIAEYELGCGHNCGSCGAACPSKKQTKFDSRHGVLLGALLSTAVFGFPVFCLVCPVGLCFAAILLIWRLFAFGDATLSVVLVITLLIIELVFLRKWCSRFCPLSALMNLVGRFSFTLKPTIDESKCLESVNGAPCSRCAMVCDYDINLRHLDYGERTLADCTRCGACRDACPAGAITIPFVSRGKKQPVMLSAEDVSSEEK